MILFSSRDLEYKAPFGAVEVGQTINYKFPVAENIHADGVSLFYRDYFTDKIKEVRLKKTSAEGVYDIFTANYTFSREGVYFYRFEIYAKNTTYYVGRDDFGRGIVGEWLPEWQQTVVKQGYSTPDFIKGGIIYHIFVDRFNRVGEIPDIPYRVKKEWNDPPTLVDPDGVYRANDIYGGNFKGITEKLPYLESLGVSMLYLSPIFDSHSNHRYDTGDYTKLDSVLGTEEDFTNLIKQAEKHGISIMLDGVFNHTGSDSVYFNEFGRYDSLGAAQSVDSPYRNWYTFNDDGTYDCWWGCTCVPTVRRNSEEFQKFIAGDNGIIEKWLKFGIKGWRLDVVDELSSGFVEKIRKKVKSIDKDALVLGEVWEDASTKESYSEKRRYFLGDQLDGVMNYPYKDAILKLAKDGNVWDFKKSIDDILENYPKCSLDVSMTMLDSHDTKRALTALSDVDWMDDRSKFEKREFTLDPYQYEKAKRRLMMASAVEYFLPGVPSVYYGDERGMQGFEDPLNRCTIKDAFDKEILEHYRFIGMIRKSMREEFKKPCEIKIDHDILMIKRDRITLYVNPTDQEKTYSKGMLKPYGYEIIKE